MDLPVEIGDGDPKKTPNGNKMLGTARRGC